MRKSWTVMAAIIAITLFAIETAGACPRRLCPLRRKTTAVLPGTLRQRARGASKDQFVSDKVTPMSSQVGLMSASDLRRRPRQRTTEFFGFLASLSNGRNSRSQR